MAIDQKFINLDKYFHESNGIVLNDIDVNMNDSVETVNRKVYKIYNNNIIPTAPQCECGNIQGRIRLNQYCYKCGTECADHNMNFKPLLWMYSIGYKFINPMFWLMLKTIMDKSVDCLRWLSDTSYNPPNRPDYLLSLLTVTDGIRSYETLITHMEDIIEFLKHISKTKTNKNNLAKLEGLKKLWIERKDVILSDYLPIPSKNLFVMEATSKGKFIELTASGAVSIVNEWMSITSEEIDNRKASKYTAKAISAISDLSKSLYTNFVIKKEGLVRKHLLGTRSHFTNRNTISCIPKPHTYNIVELPWCLLCSVYRPYVLNMLVKRKGYTLKEAKKIVNKSVHAYHPDVSEIADIMVAESGNPGMAIIGQRNPSLTQGSLQYLYGVYKKDPNDKTVGTSKLIVNAPNADYDGDCLNYTLIQDKVMEYEAEIFHPKYTVPDIEEPYSFSNSASMQGPANTVLLEYLKDKSDIEDDNSYWSEL